MIDLQARMCPNTVRIYSVLQKAHTLIEELKAIIHFCYTFTLVFAVTSLI